MKPRVLEKRQGNHHLAVRPVEQHIQRHKTGKLGQPTPTPQLGTPTSLGRLQLGVGKEAEVADKPSMAALPWPPCTI